MTISTLSFQMNAVDQMDALQQAMSRTQTQLSTGLKLQNAADNPVAMTQVDTLNSALSASGQYVTNGTLANTSLNLEAQALTDATNLLQSARDTAIQANNAALNASDRQNLATQLEQQLQQAKQDVAVSGRISSSLAAAAAAPYADCSGSYLGRLRVKRTGASPGPSTIGDSV